jgi:hypothetical protein
VDSALPTASVETDRVRDLLASDRRLIGQARALRNQVPLRTATFRQPLRVRVRRRLRHDRTLRVRLICVGLAFALAVALCLWLVGRSYAAQLPTVGALPSGQALARSPFPRLVPEVEQVAAPGSAREQKAEAHSAPPTLPTLDPGLDSETPEQPGSAISAIRRVQRADVWLRVDTPQAAREARRLLEGALAELPGSVHGQVSLAEACLRLRDETCARTAIHTAVLARPWRTKYRALAERIDQAFTDGAIVHGSGPASVDTAAPAPVGPGSQLR